MKTTLSTAVAFALLAATSAQAQSNSSTTDPNGPGQSARCDALTGAERDQCLRDENAKTQSAPEDSSKASAGSESSAAGSSAPAGSDASSSPDDRKSEDTTGDKLPATKSE